MLFAQAAPGSCAPGHDPSKACHAEFSATGPRVRADLVYDTLKVWCTTIPAKHSVVMKMRYKNPSDGVGAWTLVITDLPVTTLPDAEGFTLTVHYGCRAGGSYQASADITATDAEGNRAGGHPEGGIMTIDRAEECDQ
ncbi:MAG: hypothetical protein ACRDTT_06300 [Pseudonocardiaceae bacterium]